MPWGKPERVLIHTFDGQQWSKTTSEVTLELEPFAHGAFREAYKAQLCRPPAMTPSMYVCKMALDKNTPRSLYLHDVEAQVYAKTWADKFNASIPLDAQNQQAFPPITFVDAFVVELAERPGRPLTGCELYIEGDFTKHNNNVGAVVDGLGGAARVASDIANAFSHYTFDKSNRKILICDIQGVGSLFTDPQIHTASGKGFGVGNLGATGIKAFLLRHQCGPACRQVGLQPIVNKDLAVNADVTGGDDDIDFTVNTATNDVSLCPTAPTNPTANTATIRTISPKAGSAGHLVRDRSLHSRKGSMADTDIDDVAALLDQFDIAPISTTAPVTNTESHSTLTPTSTTPPAGAEPTTQPMARPAPPIHAESSLSVTVRPKAQALKWDVDFSDSGVGSGKEIVQGKLPRALFNIYPNSSTSEAVTAPATIPKTSSEENRIESGKGLARTPDPVRPDVTSMPSTQPVQSFKTIAVELNFDTTAPVQAPTTPETPPRSTRGDDFDFDLTLTPRGQKVHVDTSKKSPPPQDKPTLDTLLDDNWDLEDTHIPQLAPIAVECPAKPNTLARPQTKSMHLNAADEDLIDSILNDGF